VQWFKKKYCDGKFRTEVRKYFKGYINAEGGCETKDEETGEAGKDDSDPKSCCTTC
jgi:hypothetical protein